MFVSLFFLFSNFQGSPNRSMGLSGLEVKTLPANGSFVLPEDDLGLESGDIDIPVYVRPAILGWLPLVAVIFYL